MRLWSWHRRLWPVPDLPYLKEVLSNMKWKGSPGVSSHVSLAKIADVNVFYFGPAIRLDNIWQSPHFLDQHWAQITRW